MKSRKSKTQEIYEFLKKEIEAGTYSKGELLPTDLQISEKFNTSRPTVAKAVQKLVDENYLGRKAGYGTFINDRKMANSENNELNLGLLIPALGETEIFEPICGQIANLADSYNFNLVWGGGGNVHDKATEIAEQLANKYVNQKIDGVFFTPLELEENCHEINDRIIKMFEAANIAVVLLDRDIITPPLKSKYDVIGINNSEAGYVIGQHLIENGCKKIGFITRPNIASTIHMRYIGLREAILNAGLGLDSLEEFVIDGDLEAFAEQVTTRQDLDALIVYNDAAAAELCMALDNRGVQIPKDLKISAFDDVKYAKLLKTPLTTYKQPCRDIGTAAVETMISRLKNPDICARKVLLHGQLVKRESTK